MYEESAKQGKLEEDTVKDSRAGGYYDGEEQILWISDCGR